MDIAIIEMLWNPLAGLTSWLGDAITSWFTKLVSFFILLPTAIFYGLQLGLFWIIDLVQTIFKKMAGLDVYYIDGEEQSGDIVMSMLTNQIILNIFYAVLVISIMLLFVTTFVAIIRVEFTEKGAGNAKGPIIGRAIKSIVYFAVVPVTCLFGIWISNVFLRSFDQATSGNSYALSTTVFFAAAQDGNRARIDSTVANGLKDNADLLKALDLPNNVDQETLAKAIDAAFLARTRVADTPLGRDGKNYVSIDSHKDRFAYYYAAGLIHGWDVKIYTFDTSEFWGTLFFYDLFTGYNYLIGFVGGFIAASLLFSASLGLIQRIYELSILFVMAPAAVAFMPIDDGQKYKTWRGEFMKRVGSMYGPVIGLNLMFQILALLQHVTLFPGNSLYNAIMQLFFLIVGLLAVKEFSGLVSSLVGSGDALQTGEGRRKEAIPMAQKMMAGQVAALRTGRAIQKGGIKSITNRKKMASEQEKADAAKAQVDYEDKEISAATKDLQRARASGDLRAQGRAQNRIDAATKRREAAQKRFDDASGKYADLKKETLQGQINMALHGDAAKSEIGSAFGDLTKAAPILGYFTRSQIAKRAESGQTSIGQGKFFLSNDKDYMGLGEQGEGVRGSLLNIAKSNISIQRNTDEDGNYLGNRWNPLAWGVMNPTDPYGEESNLKWRYRKGDKYGAEGIYMGDKRNKDYKEEKDRDKEEQAREVVRERMQTSAAEQHLAEQWAMRYGMSTADVKNNPAFAEELKKLGMIGGAKAVQHMSQGDANAATTSLASLAAAGGDGLNVNVSGGEVGLKPDSKVKLDESSSVKIAGGKVEIEKVGELTTALNSVASALADMKTTNDELKKICTKLEGKFS